MNVFISVNNWLYLLSNSKKLIICSTSFLSLLISILIPLMLFFEISYAELINIDNTLSFLNVATCLLFVARYMQSVLIMMNINYYRN